MGLAEAPRNRSLRHWKLTVRALQLVLAVAVGAAVWFIGFSPGDGPAPALPDTETQFSLDLTVIDTTDHDIVYAVEQRARPYYRIFSLEPRTGEIETIFTVPEDAIIYGIALDPTGDALAVAYSPDFHLAGSGIWTLDLETEELTELIEVTPDRYLTDPTWSPDGTSILATEVDRRGAGEQLSAIRVSRSDGTFETLVDDGINPIQIGETVSYLTVDETRARRSIGAIDSDGTITTTEVGDATLDLDHLLPGRSDAAVRVAILETGGGGISFGDAASAHGNHDVASSWWTVELDTTADPTPSGLESIIVYDAAASDDAIVYATNEGLAIGSATRTDLIKSRAIRFVAT